MVTGFWIAVAVIMVVPLCACSEPEEDFEGQRRRLVEELRGKGIRDERVLAALLQVPRHEFIPHPYRYAAYDDRPLPIGHDQTISAPFIVAYMTEAAGISQGEKVLEIGTGSGYQAAVLAEMTDRVFSIEIIPELAETARAALEDMDYGKVVVRTGNGYHGWPEEAPFDAILVTAAPDSVPQALVDQLAVNGRMIVPVGTRHQEMVVITRTARGTVEERTLHVRFVPMVGKPR